MFEVVILQSVLKTALDYLAPTVGKNSQNLGDDCISLEATDVGSCILYTTNTIESSVLEVVCSNATKAATAPYVNFKRFKGIIESIPSNEYVTIKEGVNQLLISFSMRKSPIVINADNNGMIAKPSIIGSLPTDMAEIPVHFFNSVITKANSIIREGATAQIMNCVKLTIGNPSVTAEAIDVTSKRTFMMTDDFGINSTPQTFLIETSKMAKSLKLLEYYSTFEIGSDNAFIVIRGIKPINTSGNIIDSYYVLRKLSGSFPNVAQYYGAQYAPAEYITVSKNDILNSIARIKAIGDDTSFGTGISIKADKSEFGVSFNSQYGQLDDPVDVYNGIKGSFSMTFNHKEFEEVLKNITTDYVDIGLMAGTASNFIIKPSGSSYTGTDKFTMISRATHQQTP